MNRVIVALVVLGFSGVLYASPELTPSMGGGVPISLLETVRTWISAIFVLVGAGLGLWILWGNGFEGIKKEEVIDRLRASALLGLTLAAIYYTGHAA